MTAMRPVRPVVSCTFQPPRALVRLGGEFDLSSRGHLSDVLACLRLRGCTTVEVDAQEVTFVDASCLRVLHTEAVRLRSAGGTLRMVAASALVVRVVEAAGYLDLLPGGGPTVPSPRSGVPGLRPQTPDVVREDSPAPHPSA